MYQFFVNQNFGSDFSAKIKVLLKNSFLSFFLTVNNNWSILLQFFFESFKKKLKEKRARLFYFRELFSEILLKNFAGNFVAI